MSCSLAPNRYIQFYPKKPSHDIAEIIFQSGLDIQQPFILKDSNLLETTHSISKIDFLLIQEFAKSIFGVTHNPIHETQIGRSWMSSVRLTGLSPEEVRDLLDTSGAYIKDSWNQRMYRNERGITFLVLTDAVWVGTDNEIHKIKETTK